MSTTFEVRPTDILHDRRVHHVIRYERGDENVLRCEHVFDYPGFGHRWRWGTPGRRSYQPNFLSTLRWLYVVVFVDGTAGVCQVDHINDALAACNYRIDEMIARVPPI